jgi:uncharacterized membrane protein YidH (DUF202 family)
MHEGVHPLDDLGSVGRMIIILGIVLLIVGALVMFLGHFHLSRLPGDIVIRKKNFTFYFPVMTGIILSILLTLVLNLFCRR